MHIHFLKDFDGHKTGESKMVEPTLARRFCEQGVAIPYVTYLEKIEQERVEAKEAKAKEVAAEKVAAAPKKRATSKRASTRKKAVK